VFFNPFPSTSLIRSFLGVPQFTIEGGRGKSPTHKLVDFSALKWLFLLLIILEQIRPNRKLRLSFFFFFFGHGRDHKHYFCDAGPIGCFDPSGMISSPNFRPSSLFSTALARNFYLLSFPSLFSPAFKNRWMRFFSFLPMFAVGGPHRSRSPLEVPLKRRTRSSHGLNILSIFCDSTPGFFSLFFLQL